MTEDTLRGKALALSDEALACAHALLDSSVLIDECFGILVQDLSFEFVGKSYAKWGRTRQELLGGVTDLAASSSSLRYGSDGAYMRQDISTLGCQAHSIRSQMLLAKQGIAEAFRTRNPEASESEQMAEMMRNFSRFDDTIMGCIARLEKIEQECVSVMETL